MEGVLKDLPGVIQVSLVLHAGLLEDDFELLRQLVVHFRPDVWFLFGHAPQVLEVVLNLLFVPRALLFQGCLLDLLWLSLLLVRLDLHGLPTLSLRRGLLLGGVERDVAAAALPVFSEVEAWSRGQRQGFIDVFCHVPCFCKDLLHPLLEALSLGLGGHILQGLL